MVEETKKEVREIRAIEAQMKWNMDREDKKEHELERKVEDEEIRDWRWQQTEEMRAYVEEKTQEIRATELMESKDYQEFKREKKAEAKEDEIQFNKEVYEQDLENAAQRLELVRETAERDQEVLAERLESTLHVKDHRQQEKAKEANEQEEERLWEQSMAMRAMAEELAREKAALLESLELTKAAAARPTIPMNRTTGRSSTASRSRPS